MWYLYSLLIDSIYVGCNFSYWNDLTMDNRKTLLIASFLILVAAGMGFATRGAAGPAWAAMGIDSGNFGTCFICCFTNGVEAVYMKIILN